MFEAREYKHSGNGRMVRAEAGMYLDHNAEAVQRYAYEQMLGGKKATQLPGFRTPRDARSARDAYQALLAKDAKEAGTDLAPEQDAIKRRGPKAPVVTLTDEQAAEVARIEAEAKAAVEAIRAAAIEAAKAAAEAPEAEATESTEAEAVEAEQVPA